MVFATKTCVFGFCLSVICDGLFSSNMLHTAIHAVGLTSAVVVAKFL